MAPWPSTRSVRHNFVICTLRKPRDASVHYLPNCLTYQSSHKALLPSNCQLLLQRIYLNSPPLSELFFSHQPWRA
jgi:hypothetical protein